MTPTRWQCPNCNTANEPDARACVGCGRWPSLFDLESSGSRYRTAEAPATDREVTAGVDVEVFTDGPGDVRAPDDADEDEDTERVPLGTGDHLRARRPLRPRFLAVRPAARLTGAFPDELGARLSRAPSSPWKGTSGGDRSAGGSAWRVTRAPCNKIVSRRLVRHASTEASSRGTIRTDVLCSRHAARIPRGPVPQRAQPGQGHAVRLVAQPVHGLRAPMHLLLRPRLRGRRRSALRRPVRALDPRQDQRRRRAAAGACATILATRGGRRRRSDRSVPAGRGPLPAHPRLSRRARRLAHAVLDHHPRAADLAGRRRAAGRLRAHRVGISFSVPTLDERVWRTTEPGTAPPRRRLRSCDAWPTRASTSASRSPRSCPGSPTAPNSSPRSFAPRARPAHARSGRPSSTSVRAPASTSSRRSRATGRSSSIATRTCTPGVVPAGGGHEAHAPGGAPARARTCCATSPEAPAGS